MGVSTRLVAAALTLIGAALLIDRTVPDVDLLAIASRWWPLGLVALGIVAVFRLLPTTGAMRGPLLLVVSGAVALLFTVRPLPHWAGPLLLPMLLVGLGTGLLVFGRHGDTSPPDPDALVQRKVLVAAGEPLDWDPRIHHLLLMRAFVGGCLIKVVAPGKGMVDIKAALSGIEMIVPRGSTVHVDARGLAVRKNVTAAQEKSNAADVRIVVLSAFTTINVRAAV
jgi:hypothetical protein